MTDKRADMPDQIWAWYLHPKIQNDELQGGWTMNHDPKEAEYLRATHERRAAPDLLRLVDLVHGSFGGGLVVTFSEADAAEFAEVLAKARGQV